MAATRSADESRAGTSFLCLLTAALALLGLSVTAWASLSSLSPSAEIPNVRTVDLSDIPVGGRRTVYWRGAPVYIAHRTPEEIAQVRSIDQTWGILLHWTGFYDRVRVQREEWAVVIGRLPWWRPGCRLHGQRPGEERGDWEGWYNPCNDESFDPSGRSHKNLKWGSLQIPPYRFIGDTVIEFDDCFPWGC